eukprot:symbB.v1.2.029519.t2/scaffold3162.1/size62156/3
MTSSTTTFISPRYLYWDAGDGKLSTEIYQENEATQYWTIIFVQSGTVRLKNVGTGTFLAVSGTDFVLESTASSEGLWTYTVDTGHSNSQVSLKNSASDKYLCTAEEPELGATCDNSVVEWTISFVSNTVSLSVFTSATRTTTTGTATSMTSTLTTATETSATSTTSLTATTSSLTVTATYTSTTSLSTSSTVSSTETTTVVTATSITATVTSTTSSTATEQNARTRFDLTLKDGKYYISHYLHECHSDTTLNKDEWQHVAFVYDSTAKTQSIYLDGSLDTTCSNIESLNTDDTNRFYLGGALQRGESITWTGSIADVTIFLEVLTLEQIGIAKITACYQLPGTDCRTQLDTWHTKGACLVSADTSSLSPKSCALDDTDGDKMWRAAEDTGEYMIIDVGSNDFFVCGVVSQGSGSQSYWVNTFQVDISEDNITYAEIAGNFSTAGDQTTQKLSKFPLPMRARYVKIRPLTVNTHLAMRAGNAIDGTKCADATSYTGALATASSDGMVWYGMVWYGMVVIFGCEGLMYCGRQLDVSEDSSTWSTVLSRSTLYDAGLCYSHNSSCAMLLGKLLFSSHPAKENDTAPTVEYDDIEDSHGTIFRFDLRAVRYVRVWSSISSTATAVHFAEIAPGREVYEEAPEKSYQFDSQISSTKVKMGSLDNLGISSGDYTFMTFWDASSLGTNDGVSYYLFGTESSGMNIYVKKTGTTAVTLYHGTSATCQASVTIQEAWNHVAVAYSSSGQTSTFYVNGEAATMTCSTFSTAGTTAYYGGTDSQTWAGNLEQAQLYTKAIGTDDLLNFSNWYTSRRRNYCFRDCNEALCCTWRELGNFELLDSSTPTVASHASAAWEDAGSNCTDQFSDALAVNVTGSVDRTTLGTYTITYDCTENSGSKILDTKTRTVTVVESMYINPDVYWIVQREAGEWKDEASQCYATAAPRIRCRSMQVNYTVTYACSLTGETIEKTLMVRDSIRLYGPDPHVVRAGRLRWHSGQCEICNTTSTNSGESSCSYSSDNSTTTDKCWKASTDDGAGTYVELDLGSDMVVAGVVTKGHSIEAAWIKTFTVSYKADGGSTYSSIDSTFTGNSDQNTEVENMFSATQSARYWRITAQTFEEVVAARVAMIVCNSQSGNTHAECMCGYVTAPADEQCRTDVWADCIDATGTSGTVSLDIPTIYAMEPSETVVTYSCTGATSYTRTVKIRDAIELVGDAFILVPAGASGSWTDASGDFIETGATCITHEGEDDTPTADLTYLPFSTERTYVINYECRRRAAPILQRTVAVRAQRQEGGELGSVTSHVEDDWSCIDVTGASQSSTRLPTTSDSVFFDRYFESYLSYPFPSCSAEVPTIVRSGEIRHPIYLQGDRQEWRLGIGISTTGTITTLGKSDFEERFGASFFKIIRRTCPSCDASHQDIYYRRLTDMPSTFSAYMMMACEWTSTDNVGNGADCQHDGDNAINEARLGFLMYTKANRDTRWSTTTAATGGYAENLVCARFTGREWQYLEASTWTKFIPVPTDVLLARIEFDNSTITSLKGEDQEFFTVKMGFVDGDLEFTFGTNVMTVAGTSFVARCGEDLWCSTGVRASDADGALFCCTATCGTCGGSDCSSNGDLDICCLDTLLDAGRVCRDHSDVSCLIPETSVLCGGSLQLNNFDTAAAMESAGWTIDTSDTNAWQEDSSYIGYRGSPSAGISLTLTGYGTLELTFGNGNAAATDTVEVLLDSVSHATASSTDSEKTVSIDFAHENILQIRNNGDSIILVKGIAFKCMFQKMWPRVVIQKGEFDAPEEYTPWPAEDCKHEYETEGSLTGTVSLSTSSVSTALEGLFTVTYSCTLRDVESTRSVTVQVRHPIKFSGQSAMIVQQSATGTFTEPGVACISRDLVPLTVTSSPSPLSLETVGDFSITYSCTDAEGRTSSRVRYVQVAPAIQLRGESTVVLEKDTTWNDPMVQCVDVDGGLVQPTASPTIDMSQTQDTEVTYSCVDSAATQSTAKRRVIVTSGQPIPVVQGPKAAIVLLGEEFTDPGVCCRDDHNQVLPFTSVINTADSSQTGTQTLFYSCIGSSTAETAQRSLTVNNVPKVFLTGDADTLSLLGSEYTDDGAVCADVEDGLITSWGSAGLGSSQQLATLRAGYSGTVDAGAVENVIDGDEASSTLYECESCVKLQADSSSYIWVDLGAGKVVHSVNLAAEVTGATLKVGPDINTGPTCKTDITVSTRGSASDGAQECDAPLAGRFVTLTGSSSSMTVCEIIVYGTVGPAPATRINITGNPSGCTGTDSNTFSFSLELAGQDSLGLGVSYSIQQAGDYGEMRTDLGTGPILQTELVDNTVKGTHGSEVWILKDSSQVEQARASGGESFPPLEPSQWTISTDATCTSIVFEIDPADSCAWLFGPSSENGKYGCGDGSECDTEGCCLTLGGLAHCPPDAPRMCEDMTCSSDYCCSSTCTSLGGDRLCKQSATSSSTGSSSLARMEVVNSVVPDTPAIYKVTYTCYDSVGAHVSVTRTVEVACEEPNPGGTYGGNRVACTTTQETHEDVADYQSCETKNAGHADPHRRKCGVLGCILTCKIMPFWPCHLALQLVGRYFTIVNSTDRSVAYCRRVDTPPKIFLEDGTSWFLLGAAAKAEDLPAVTCTDSEDAGNMADPTNDFTDKAVKRLRSFSGLSKPQNLWEMCCDPFRFDVYGHSICFKGSWEVRSCCSALQQPEHFSVILHRVITSIESKSVFGRLERHLAKVRNSLNEFALVTYHKTGTFVATQLLGYNLPQGPLAFLLLKNSSRRWETGLQNASRKEEDIEGISPWMRESSTGRLALLYSPPESDMPAQRRLHFTLAAGKLIHFIRRPSHVIVSSYIYHLQGSRFEYWMHTSNPPNCHHCDFEAWDIIFRPCAFQCTFFDRLRQLDVKEGLRVEILRARWTIVKMLNNFNRWKAAPNVLHMQAADFQINLTESLRKMGKFLKPTLKPTSRLGQMVSMAKNWGLDLQYARQQCSCTTSKCHQCNPNMLLALTHASPTTKTQRVRETLESIEEWKRFIQPADHFFDKLVGQTRTQQSCKESNTAGEVPDSSICTPQCDDGYVPKVNGVSGYTATLSCLAKVLTPSTFQCDLPAAQALSIFAPSRPKPEGAVDITLQFATGNANDCVWQGFEFQGQEVDVDTDWREMVGCENSVFTSRDTVTCMATGLTEGTFKFQAILLKLPEEDQYATVSQVLLAVQVDVYITTDTSIAFVVDRTNVREGGEEWCPTTTWRVAANEITDGSPSGTSTVGLIQSRILIANFPGDDFIKPGCKYDIACEAGLFVTEDTPSKVELQLHRPFPSTVAARSPDDGPLLATGRVSSGAVREPIYSSVANRSEGQYLVYDATLADILVTGLVPSKRLLKLSCLCQRETQTYEQVKTGIVMLLSTYERACGDVVMLVGEIATITVSFVVNPLSDYANLTFHNAEYETHELSYTKQSDDAGLLMVTNSMDFTVCPHAHYHYDEAASASTCTNYVVNVSFTDTKLAITSISVTSDDGTTWSVTGTGSEIAVSNGDTVTFEMEKDPVTSLFDINISIGGESYFPQTKESVTEEETTGRMVKMKMSGSEFDMEYKMTFKTPIITVTKSYPTLTGTSQSLSTALDNVPTSSEVGASPAAFLRLSVRKVDSDQETPGFCESQTFSSGWTKLSCDLTITPLSADSLVVEIEVYNFSSTLWQVASDFSETGAIEYQVPIVDSLYTQDASGNTVDTVSTETIMLSDPVFYIRGSLFASLDTMSLTYVDTTEYKLWLQGVDPELSLCTSIEYVSDTSLKCYITSCLDAREIPSDPSVVLQIGDLRSAAKAGVLTLPVPAISSITPTLIQDAGYAEIEIFGNSFSEYLAADGDFAEACAAWQLKLEDLLAADTTRPEECGCLNVAY